MLVTMSEMPLQTLWMQRCVERWRSGDRDAADELLRSVGARLENLARKMLRAFPNVKQWADTGDVLQGAVLRLLITLKKLEPGTTRDFFNLAAVHVRRELLDLARHFRNRIGRVPVNNGASDSGMVAELAASAWDGDLDLWCRFHEAVEKLPADKREVVSLVFYHGWSQEQIADLFQVNERTVRRRWQSTCLELNRLVGGELPSADE